VPSRGDDGSLGVDGRRPRNVGDVCADLAPQLAVLEQKHVPFNSSRGHFHVDFVEAQPEMVQFGVDPHLKINQYRSVPFEGCIFYFVCSTLVQPFSTT